MQCKEYCCGGDCNLPATRLCPSTCDAGYVCGTRGIAKQSVPCPKGHYCNRGTISAIPLYNAVEPFNLSAGKVFAPNLPPTGVPVNNSTLPLPCPKSSFCLGGVAGVTIDATDPILPKPCTPGYFCLQGSDTPQGRAGLGICPAGSYVVHTTIFASIPFVTQSSKRDSSSSLLLAGSVHCSPNYQQWLDQGTKSLKLERMWIQYARLGPSLILQAQFDAKIVLWAIIVLMQ